MPFGKWIGVTGIVVLSAASLAALSGAVYEQFSRADANRRFVAPGRVVDIGKGLRMQIDCRGTGSPVVVLEAGLGMYGSLSWSAVHDSVAATTRTCAYSRAGLMWSKPRRASFSAEQAARELHATLDAAGERGPYVMVGHSLGGPYVMVFTRLYGAEVAGMVLVDPTHPDQFPRYRQATGTEMMPTAKEAKLGAALSWTGLLRKLPPTPNAPGWAKAIDSVATPFLPVSVQALADETEAIPRTLAESRTLTTLGDRPFVVLTAMADTLDPQVVAMGITKEQGERLDAARRELHEAQSRLSTRGQHRLVTGAGHYIQFDKPMAVVTAVRETVLASRERR